MTLLELEEALREAEIRAQVLVADLPEGRTLDVVMAVAMDLQHRLKDVRREREVLARHGDAA